MSVGSLRVVRLVFNFSSRRLSLRWPLGCLSPPGPPGGPSASCCRLWWRSVLEPELLIISISACLAGAVCGDHCSPISDTTIMSSTGAMCNHINHVTTQLPYALTVAAVSFVGYIFAGFVQSAWVVLPVSMLMLFAVLYVIKLATGS